MTKKEFVQKYNLDYYRGLSTTTNDQDTLLGIYRDNQRAIEILESISYAKTVQSPEDQIAWTKVEDYYKDYQSRIQYHLDNRFICADLEEKYQEYNDRFEAEKKLSNNQ